MTVSQASAAWQHEIPADALQPELFGAVDGRENLTADRLSLARRTEETTCG